MLNEPDCSKQDDLLRVITEGGIEGWSNGIVAERVRVITSKFRTHLSGRDALARFAAMLEVQEVVTTDAVAIDGGPS